MQWRPRTSIRHPREVLTATSPEPDLVLRYGDRLDQIADVHLPASPRSAPVLVLLHGGFWRDEHDRRHTRPLANALAAQGWVVATPEYTRIPSENVCEGRAPLPIWPVMSADVLQALRHLPAELASQVGCQSGVPVLVGHSAGGHLALWASTQVDVAVTVALAPVADLDLAHRLQLDNGVVDLLVSAELRKSISPSHQPQLSLTPQGPTPVYVLHGDADEQVPLALSQSYVHAHQHAQLQVLIGSEHFALIDPEQHAGRAVLELTAQLRRPSEPLATN